MQGLQRFLTAYDMACLPVGTVSWSAWLVGLTLR